MFTSALGKQHDTKNSAGAFRVLGIAMIGAAIVALGANEGWAVTIGPGSGVTGVTDQDTPGAERLNVDRTKSINFAAGTYNLSNWRLNVFDHTEGGTITPMLVTGTPASYTTLWLGSAFNPTSNGVQTVAASGSFVLGSPTTVYAGFFTEGTGSGIIALDNGNNVGNGESRTDHDTSFTTPLIGNVPEALGGISNANLTRTYAFEVNASPSVLSTGGLIGAGAATLGGSADNGGRTNIEQDFLTLEAGTYDVSDFDFHAVNTSGTVQPFLATRTSTTPRQYTPIWVGSAIAPAATGINTEIYASGDETFTLTEATDVYAGFAMTSNAVGFFGGGFTDHNGAAPTPIVGAEFASFTNNNLGRTYSFGINVALQPTPEPTSALLLGLGAVVGIATLRRKRN